jgi:hypothetical protein
MAYTTIDDPSAYFQTTLYTGDGANSLAITNSGNSDLQADWIWIKERNGTRDHSIFDSVRGVVKRLESNTTNAEGDETAGLLSLNSDGFTVGADGYVNTDDNTYVAWQWKETADAGFDIVSYTGNATGGRTIAHSLSAVPAMMIVKNRAASIKWAVYHHKNTAAPATDHLKLNADDATADDDSTWNDTAPTSSVFSVGGSTSTNGDSTAYIAYLFAEKQGYSKFGSYTGNNNANGPFIYLGFKPAWVMVKKYTATNHWIIWDNKRATKNGNNIIDKKLYANLSHAENGADDVSFLSNGFKLHTNTGDWNEAESYIFMAFAENPLVTSTGIPATAE